MRSQESNGTAAGGENLQLNTRDEQLDVLAKVLSAGEDEAGIEVAPVGDDIARTKSSLAQRTTGNLAALSGAHGLTYMEVQFWMPPLRPFHANAADIVIRACHLRKHCLLCMQAELYCASHTHRSCRGI